MEFKTEDYLNCGSWHNTNKSVCSHGICLCLQFKVSSTFCIYIYVVIFIVVLCNFFYRHCWRHVQEIVLSLCGCVAVVKTAPAAGARERRTEGRGEETPSRVEEVSRRSRRAKRGDSLVDAVLLFAQGGLTIQVSEHWTWSRSRCKCSQPAGNFVTLCHPLGGKLPLLSARTAVTFLAEEHHRQPAGTKLYSLVTGTCMWAACPRLLPGSRYEAEDTNSRPFGSRANALTLNQTLFTFTNYFYLLTYMVIKTLADWYDSATGDGVTEAVCGDGSWLVIDDDVEQCIVTAQSVHGQSVRPQPTVCWSNIDSLLTHSYSQRSSLCSPCERTRWPISSLPGDAKCVQFWGERKISSKLDAAFAVRSLLDDKKNYSALRPSAASRFNRLAVYVWRCGGVRIKTERFSEPFHSHWIVAG